MATKNELIIKINGDTKGYKKSLKAVTAETEKLQEVLTSIAKVSAIAFAATGVAVFAATKKFADFDHGLRGVKTLLDEASFSAKGLEEGFANMAGEALEVFREIPISLDGVTKSLFDIVSAGVPAGEAVSVLASTARLAVAGLTDVSVATDGVTSALNAYGLSASEAELVAAKFFTAQKFGKVTIKELSDFFGVAASSSAAYGVSLDELLAATAAATAGSIKASTAFAALPAVFSSITKPAKEAKKEAKRLGIEFNSTALRSQGLAKFLDTLTSSQNFNKSSLEKLFGSTEALNIVFALTGSQSKKFKTTLDALSNSQKVLTTFTKAYEVQSKSLKNQTKLLTNNFDALQIMIGGELEPVVSLITSSFSTFLDLLHASPAIASFISKALVAIGVLSSLALGAALFSSALLKVRAALILTGKASKIMIGATGLGLIVAFLPEIIELFDFVFTGAKNIVERTGGAIGKAASGLANILQGLFTFDLTQVQQGFNEFQSAFSEMAKATVEEFKKTSRSTVAAEQAAVRAIEAGASAKIAAMGGVAQVHANITQGSVVFDSVSTASSIKADRAKEESRAQAVAREIEQEEKRREREELSLEERKTSLEAEQAVLKAHQDKMSRAEIGFLEQRQALAKEGAAANAIIDEEEKGLALENIKLKNASLTAAELTFFAERNELREEQREKEISLQAELDELDASSNAQLDANHKSRRDGLNKADLKSLKDSIKTKAQIKSEAVKAELLKQRGDDALFLKDKKHGGKLFAQLQALQRSDEVRNASSAAGELAALQDSSNKELAAIGKAAALVQIVIDTQRGALAAYSSMAGFGVAGQIAGVAMAGALFAYGAERAVRVAGAQQGGIVEGAGLGDTVPFLLEPGELITPRQNFDEVVNAVANARVIEAGGTPASIASEEEEDDKAVRIEIGFDGDEAAAVLTLQQNESSILGFSEVVG